MTYSAVTNRIEVKVTPRFLPEHSNPDKSQYVWAYSVEIRNLGEEPVRLKARHWIIRDATGHVEEVRGPGVVGEQPLLQPGGNFSYTSGCPLATPSGFMVGSYEMEREDGTRFLVEIPAFSLDLPDSKPTMN